MAGLPGGEVNGFAQRATRRTIVLIVDDQPTVADAIKRMLLEDPQMDVHYCSDVGSALRVAHQVHPTVILQDLVMPNVDGFAMLRFFRADREVSNVPVIVLSSKEDPRDKSKAFELGASDYLVKVPDKIELLARVRAHARAFFLQAERDEAFRAVEQMKKQLEERNVELQRLSMTDGLTAIPNRRHFDDMLQREWRRGHRDKFPVALIMIDVDQFKRYNDTYGHQAGDECLQRIAEVLKNVARRPGDVAARYGGEEFALLLPQTDVDGACVVASNLKMLVEKLNIPHSASEVAPHVTLSLGIACVTEPPASMQPDELVAIADRALYRSKRNGRNRWTVAEETEVEAREHLTTELPPP